MLLKLKLTQLDFGRIGKYEHDNQWVFWYTATNQATYGYNANCRKDFNYCLNDNRHGLGRDGMIYIHLYKNQRQGAHSNIKKNKVYFLRYMLNDRGCY